MKPCQEHLPTLRVVCWPTKWFMPLLPVSRTGKLD